MEHPNFAAVIVAAIAVFFFGWLWYTPLFGKQWAAELKLPTGGKPPAGAMARGMILMLVGNLLMAHVFASNAGAWRVVMPAGAFQFAFMGAFFTWLGFFLPQDLSRLAWENKSWKLFGINTAHHFLSLMIVALILAYWP